MGVPRACQPDLRRAREADRPATGRVDAHRDHEDRTNEEALDGVRNVCPNASAMRTGMIRHPSRAAERPAYAETAVPRPGRDPPRVRPTPASPLIDGGRVRDHERTL